MDEKRIIKEFLDENVSNQEIREKLFNELDSNNNSTFEDTINELIDVDIFDGIRCLLAFTKDGDKCADNIIESAYFKSGIKYVEERIRHYLIDSNIASNVLVEYSLLSSTLNPKNPDKLQCCSFIISDDPSFKEAVNWYYTKCISETEKKEGISIYQHPKFLYDVQKDKSLTITASNDLPVGDFTIKKETVKPEEKGKFKKYNNLFIEAFGLPRNFKEMLFGAKNYSGSSTLLDLQKTLHSFCHTNISNRNGFAIPSIYTSFPIHGSKSSNQLPQYAISLDALQGIGACFIYFEPKKMDYTETDFNYMKLTLEKISYEVGKIIRFISVNYLFNLGLQLQESARKEAIKSAISAIMSRNMSHNLGSHYMYYTKAYLEQLANSVGNIAPDIRGAAKVMGYVQARMDYLATVISNDKYPYGAVNFKSQIYDELTIDDFSHRHFLDEKDKPKRITNFLLKNLVYSENLTRQDVRSDEELEFKGNQLFLHVKLLRGNDKFAKFTGTWHSSKLDWVDEKLEKDPSCMPTLKAEEDVKNKLSSLNIALPGGSMSCHALFNVIENFIRNSAKYLQNDLNKNAGLVCTLVIAPHKTDNKYVDITIYDNKRNANEIVDANNGVTLFQQILDKLSKIIIIDDQNKISKENKGFKEMLFSAIWMRAYTFGNDKTYADIISDINIAESGEEKLRLIEDHGFSLVKVVDEQDSDVKIYSRDKECNTECNLGLQITLPLFKESDTITLTNNKATDVDNILNTMADIVEVDKDFFSSQYRHVFTRPLLKTEAEGKTDYEKYHKVVEDRFADIDKYALSLKKAESHFNNTPIEYQIFFKHHMSTSGNADPKEYQDYAYADSVSGGNFTITLRDLFCNGYENGNYKSDNDKILALKIKESALTRITIIDERLFNSTHETDYPWLALKNIRVLNYNDSINEEMAEGSNHESSSVSHIFMGNQFRDKKDFTHFLTIHLGLIEKILKNSDYINSLINQKLGIKDSSEKVDPLEPTRVKTFMSLLRNQFCGSDPKMLYIAIHSGRGNYSAELEGPLSKYPFISLSALESAFNNSKYQLSQLLYNTVYIGKGFANNINGKKQ